MATAHKQLALAKSKSVASRVAAIPPKKGQKRSPDDAFVVGTADLRLSDKHADVRFQVLKGVKTVADFLLDYVLAPPQGVKRDWHIFYRTHSEDDANKYVEQSAERVRRHGNQARGDRPNLRGGLHLAMLRALAPAVVSTAIGPAGIAMRSACAAAF